MVWYLEVLYREYHGIPRIKKHIISISISKNITKIMLMQWYFFLSETNTAAYTQIIGEMINQMLHLK